MAISIFDLTKGLDFTGLLNDEATAADHNTLVDAASPYALDKGIVMMSNDTALGVPDVPNAAVTTKWKNYLWIRRPHSTATPSTALIPIVYMWNENRATSDATYLKWERVPADTSAVEALITALTLRVEDLEATSATLISLVNTANSNAATANTNAAAAVSTATAANANALQALSDLDTPVTGVKARVTALETRMTVAEANITTINATLLTLVALPAQVAASVILESANYVIGSGVFATIAHGLGGVKPKYVKSVLICVTNDAASGYVVGDEFPLVAASQTAANTVFGEIVNSSHIILSLEPTAVGIWNINHKTTGARVIPSSAGNFQAKSYYAKQ